MAFAGYIVLVCEYVCVCMCVCVHACDNTSPWGYLPCCRFGEFFFFVVCQFRKGVYVEHSTRSNTPPLVFEALRTDTIPAPLLCPIYFPCSVSWCTPYYRFVVGSLVEIRYRSSRFRSTLPTNKLRLTPPCYDWPVIFIVVTYWRLEVLKNTIEPFVKSNKL